MPRRARIDIWLVLPVTLLVVLGIVMIYSASAFVAVKKNQPQYYYLVRQLVFALIGGGALVLVNRVNYRIYRRWARLSAAGVIVLLVGVLVPFIGHFKGGVRRWIGLGPIDFQLSELAKIGLMIFLAAVLAA